MKEVEGQGRVFSQEDILKKYDVNRKVYRQWVKNRKSITKLVEEEGQGKHKKIVHNDPLERVKQAVKAFFDANENMPKDAKIPVMCSVITSRALLSRDHLLKKHSEEAFLMEEEEFALQHFTASQSWSSKHARLFGWVSKALHGEAGSVDIEGISNEIDDLCLLIAE